MPISYSNDFAGEMDGSLPMGVATKPGGTEAALEGCCYSIPGVF